MGLRETVAEEVVSVFPTESFSWSLGTSREVRRTYGVIRAAAVASHSRLDDYVVVSCLLVFAVTYFGSR